MTETKALGLIRHCAAKGCGCEDESKLFKCDRCRSVNYCSAKCRDLDWSRHKDACETVSGRLGPMTAETERKEMSADRKFVEANISEIRDIWERETKAKGHGVLRCAPTALFVKCFGSFYPAAIAALKHTESKNVVFRFIPIADLEKMERSSIIRWVTHSDSQNDIFCAVCSSFSAQGSTTFRIFTKPSLQVAMVPMS